MEEGGGQRGPVARIGELEGGGGLGAWADMGRLLWDDPDE
jgi:hypothetical protein